MELGVAGTRGQRFKALNGLRVTGITQWTSHSAPEQDRAEE